MPTDNNVVLEVVERKHFEGVASVRSTFLNSKHCCCLLPLGMGSLEEVTKMYKKTPELMEVSCVALLPDQGVVGYCQMILEGMPCDLHKVEPGEAYIFMLAVDPDARGMGIGTKMMAWAEEVALARGCKFMSLEVVGGNPAIGLYKRKGYTVKPPSILSRICWFPFICCLMGPVMCPSGSPSYCSYGTAHFMVKPLS